jgi:hypothetical protein
LVEQALSDPGQQLAFQNWIAGEQNAARAQHPGPARRPSPRPSPNQPPRIPSPTPKPTTNPQRVVTPGPTPGHGEPDYPSGGMQFVPGVPRQRRTRYVPPRAPTIEVSPGTRGSFGRNPYIGRMPNVSRRARPY